MKTLVISRPVYDVVLPLVDFPEDGDKFFINNSIKSISNVGSMVALTFAKYNMDVSFTGMVGDDFIGNKIKEIFIEKNIDTKYIETSYTEKTCVSYKIYNSKTNKFTIIDEKCLKNNLTKYKYEFIPNVVIMDDKDYGANVASINNYPEALSIFIADKFTKASSLYCTKCKFVVCDLKFASSITGVQNDLNKTKNIILLFQKYIDLYKSNLIIKLDNYDMLYCVNDEVRLIKNINKNIKNKDNVYYAVLSYFLANNIDVENSIKLTNKAMLSSNNELDMMNNIPDISVINQIVLEYEEMKKKVVVNDNIVSNLEMEKLNITENTNNNINSNNVVRNNQNIDMPGLGQDSNVEGNNVESL